MSYKNSMDRRNFLLTTAAAAQPGFGQTASEPVRTAVIGTGNRGSHLLMGVIEHSVAKVTALCDNKPDRLDKAATAAAKHSPATHTDWRRIVERKDVDAIFIATPPHLHSEMAIASLQAGKHVYCEKPIGVNAAQVRELVKVARSTKKVFVSGQQLRSFQQLIAAVGKLRQGVIGDVIMVKAQRHASSDLNHQGTSADWYFDVTKSGGYLIEQSVHNLDACNWVIGAHPVRASGFGQTLLHKNDPPGRTIFDCANLAFEYPNGVQLSFTQNVFHPQGMPVPNQTIFIFGTKGAVDLLYSTNMYTLGGKGEAQQLAPERQEAQHGHITAFYDCILKGSPNPADIEVGATAALTSILGHEAMTRQRVVNWSDLDGGIS